MATFTPMLAKPFSKWDRLPKGAVFSQPKLNGVRCIATASGLWSRTGYPITSCPHIMATLAPIFDRAPGLVLDGELYNHDLHHDLNGLLSIVQRQEDWDGRSAALVGYHVYDVPSLDAPFSARLEALRSLPEAPAVHVVPTLHIADADALDTAYGEYLASSFEGQMVRIDGPYRGGRSPLLLKRKQFQDAEFPLVDVREASGSWAGHAKHASLRLPDGRVFGASIAGTRAFLSDLLRDWRRYSMATVRFAGLSAEGVPVPAVALAFHTGSRTH